jgi:hypothetical protein
VCIFSVLCDTKMADQQRLNLGLSQDGGDALAALVADTGYSRSLVTSLALKTLHGIRAHGKGRALVLTDDPRPSDILVLQTL